MSSTSFKVTTWSPTSPFASAIPYDIYQSTIASSLPAYSLPSEKFHSLLIAPLAKVFVATSTSTSSSEAKKDDILGFALTYLIRSGSASNQALQHQKGSLALLCVSTPHQHRGIGSSLHTAALDHLNSAVKASLSLSTPIPSTSPPLQLGSIFPRIFPGIPEGPEFDDARKWFEKKGWEFQSGEQSIDLYQSLTPGLPPPELEGLMEQAEKAGITFGPLKETDDQGLIALQKAEFDSFTGWPDMFPALIKAGHRDDIECAFDRDGKVVGATVAALGPLSGGLREEGPMHGSLAWPCTLGKRCGIIACVGISSQTRGSGAGIAMVSSAVNRLAQRGADGCFVDWVQLKGFYQKAGFQKWEKGYLEASRPVET